MKLGSRFIAYIAACGLLWSNWCEYKRKPRRWSLVSIRFGSIDMQKTIIELFKRN